MVELLAPAGSREALIAAIESGANAVYLAGNMFGARAYADNFDENGMIEAVRMAHLRNVQVHVTVNTIVDDRELPQLKKYLQFLDEIGVDAVLVQDLGVAKLAKEVAPNLPLHASTQMTVHNLDGVRALEKLGFSRVVLSRELSLDAIRHICASSRVEIEVFVHGALCVCYSGQCLMSSIIGGRSGNRGRCAQPCRLPYELVDENDKNLLGDKAGKYLLSPRDMKGIDLLPQLIEAGVASLKIEGRMKRPEYVAIVVNNYRKSIDSYYEGEFTVTEAQQRQLLQIFNRDFTTAYMEKKQGKNMMSDRRPNNRGLMVGRVVRYDRDKKRAFLKLSGELRENDQIDFWVKVGGRVTATVKDMKDEGKGIVSFLVDSSVYESDRAFKVYDAELMSLAAGFYNSGAPVRRVPVEVMVSASIGKPLQITMTDIDGNRAEAQTEFIGEKAQKRPLSRETVEKQISRLGASIFELSNLIADIRGKVMVPVSEINEARRRAVEQLEALRLSSYEENARSAPRFSEDDKLCNEIKIPVNKEKNTSKLSVHVDTLEKLQTAITAGADIIIFGGDTYNHEYLTPDMYQRAAFMVHRANKAIYFGTSRIIRNSDMSLLHKFLDIINHGNDNTKPDAIMVHNIGTAMAVRTHTDIPLFIDYSLISYNAKTLEFWQEQGAVGVTLSPELNFTQIQELARTNKAHGLQLECMAEGNLELMVSEYCCTGSFIGGLDRGKCSAPCVNSGKKFFLKDRKGVKFPLVMDQNCHMHVLNGNRLSMLPHAMKFGKIGIDSIRIDGRYMETKEIQEIIGSYKHFMMLDDEVEIQEADNITRGHYFRGVQ